MANGRSEHRSSNSIVAGLGASAGGLAALSTLLAALPERIGMTLIVIQHLDPRHPSQLVEILSRIAPLRVCDAADGLQLAPDTIYVAPPGMTITLEQARLRARRIDDEGPAGASTINTFFESLATELGQSAIGVILSGTGTDGAAGCIRIKQAGGKVFVQDPATATYDGMPRSAIATRSVDRVLPLEAIAHKLRAAVLPRGRILLDVPWQDKVDQPVNDIIALVRNNAGFDLSAYKLTPLLWRIQQRMRCRRIERHGDYEALLRKDTGELEALVRGIPIHVTAFFRDLDAWESLAQRAIRPLIADHRDKRTLRAWTPACASGEEAFSLAMILTEQAEALNRCCDFQVFATDASPDIIAKASRSVFSAAAVETMPLERRMRFFCAANGAMRVRRSLREKMIFAPQNLLTDAPFADLDIVTCRNLLIYLEPDASRRILRLLHGSLRMGGYLFLGKSEAFSPGPLGFEVLSMAHNIYQKTALASDLPPPKTARRKGGLPKVAGSQAVDETVHRALMETFGLPSVLIDDQFQILRIYGDTRHLLRLPPGEPTLNLMEVARPSLVPDLGRAIHRAFASGHTEKVDPLCDQADTTPLSLRLTPLKVPAQGAPRRMLISFLTVEAALATQGEQVPLPVRAPDPAPLLVQDEALRMSNEELEASREELQALNEELRSVNDQLNISNEEVSEANARLLDTIDELRTQSNVLSSGAVMTLFLDEDLRVRWFTPAIVDLFPLMPGDRGRRITDFAPKFKDDHFIHDVQQVMRTGELLESKITKPDHSWYLRRIRPYFATAGQPTGVAITYTDITALKRAEDALRASEKRQAFLLKLSDALRPLDDSIAIQHVACRVLGEHLEVNRACYAQIDAGHYLVVEHFTRDIPDFPARRYPVEAFGERIVQSLQAGQRVVVADSRNQNWFGGQLPAYEELSIRSFAVVPCVKSGRLVSSLAVTCALPRIWTDEEIALIEETAERTWAAAERSKAEAALRLSEEKYRTLFESIDQGFGLVDVVLEPAGNVAHLEIVEANLIFRRHAGSLTSSARLPGDPAISIGNLADIATTGRPVKVELFDDRTGRWFKVFASRIGGAGSRRIAIILDDVSARKQAEEALRASEARQAYLLMLSDALRPIDEPSIVQQVAARVLGLHLGADRAFYVEVEGDNFVFEAHYARDIELMSSGLYPVEDYGKSVITTLRAGRSVVVHDVENDDLLLDVQRAFYTDIAVRAFVGVPLLKAAKLVAVLGVTCAAPRRWTEEDLALIEETAERTWSAVVRAKAEADRRRAFDALCERIHDQGPPATAPQKADQEQAVECRSAAES